MMSSLDAKQQGLLAKHPDNPNPTTDHPIPEVKPVHSSLKATIAAHKKAKATGKDLALRPRSTQTTSVVPDTSDIDSLFEEPTNPSLENAKQITAKHPEKPNATIDNPATDKRTISVNKLTSDRPATESKAVPSTLKETIAPKAPGETIAAKPTGDTIAAEPIGETVAAKPTGETVAAEPTGETVAAKPTGEELPQGPQKAHQATVEDDTSIDDLFIERPEPPVPVPASAPEDAKADSKAAPWKDSIFGEKRAREAELNPQPEQVSTSASHGNSMCLQDCQLPKDVKRLLTGPPRRPRQLPPPKTAEELCFIKPRKPKAKAQEDQGQKRVRPRPEVGSPKPVRIDSSHWGWRKCLLSGQTLRGLTGLLSDRMELDDNSLSTVKLEDSLEVVTDMCKTPDAICAILEFIEDCEDHPTKTEGKNVAGMKSTALYVLSYLLRRLVRDNKTGKQPLSDKQSLPLAMLARKYMNDESTDVRASTMNYCIYLYAATTSLQFWKVSEDDEALEPLIWFYLMKNGNRT